MTTETEEIENKLQEYSGSQQLNEVSKSSGVFNSMQNFENAQRMARALASSSLVPRDYQGNDKLGNCLIALEVSQRTGSSVLMVMQNLYIVHGRPGWSSQYIIAAINSCGRFSALQFEMVGDEGSDDWKCRAWAKEKATGEKVYGAWVSIGMAKAEGWYGKNGSKWQTMPEVMLRYRAASFFGKTYAPEILMGMQTAEEVEDIKDVTEASSIVKETQEIEDIVSGEVLSENKTYAQLAESLNAAKTKKEKQEIIDQASHLPANQIDELKQLAGI